MRVFHFRKWMIDLERATSLAQCASHVKRATQRRRATHARRPGDVQRLPRRRRPDAHLPGRVHSHGRATARAQRQVLPGVRVQTHGAVRVHRNTLTAHPLAKRDRAGGA